jgi:HAD superfamily hydrolase (TIGR01509 family)
MAGKYDAVLFDFDGVLVDSEPVHFECWREILDGYGITLDWPTYCEQGIGISDRLMLQFLCNQVDPPLAVERLIAEYPRKKQMFLDRMLGDPRITQEVRDLLEELSSGYKLAVVTSSGRTEVEPLLNAAGLLDFFHTGVYSQDVKRKKPEPDPYLLAVERLNASNALVVEDSDAGEASGRAAGLDVLRIRAAEEMVPRVRELLNL